MASSAGSPPRPSRKPKEKAMPDDTTTTEPTGADQTTQAQLAPDAQPGTPQAPAAEAKLTTENLGPIPYTATDLKVTALRSAIDHAKNQGQQHGANDVVGIAEAFWRWLIKEVKEIA